MPGDRLNPESRLFSQPSFLLRGKPGFSKAISGWSKSLLPANRPENPVFQGLEIDPSGAGGLLYAPLRRNPISRGFYAWQIQF